MQSTPKNIPKKYPSNAIIRNIPTNIDKIVPKTKKWEKVISNALVKYNTTAQIKPGIIEPPI